MESDRDLESAVDSEDAPDSAPAPPQRPPERRRWLSAIRPEYSLAFGAVGLVVGAVGLYVGLRHPDNTAATGTRGLPHGPPTTAPPGPSSTTPTAPKTTVQLKLGTEQARPHLLADWRPAIDVDGRLAAPNAGPAPAVRFDVAADERGMLAHVVGKADPSVGPQPLALSVDEREVGVILLEPTWTRAHLPLPAGAVSPGPHVLTLRLAHEKGQSRAGAVLLEQLSIGPLAPATVVVCANPAAATLLITGWSRPEFDDKRAAVWSDGDSSRIHLLLAPQGETYWLGLAARAHQDLPGDTLTVNLQLNDEKLGSLEISKQWDVYYLPVKAAALRHGVNVLDLNHGATTAQQGPSPDSPRRVALMVERVDLRPATPTLEIDVGHPDDRIYLAGGFTPDPPWGERRWVFSEGKRSRLRVPLAAAARAHALQVTAFGFEPIAPVQVTVSVNRDKALAKLEVPVEEKTLTVSIPAQSLVAGTNTIDLEYARTGQPRQFSDASQDDRELAVGWVAVKLAPAP